MKQRIIWVSIIGWLLIASTRLSVLAQPAPARWMPLVIAEVRHDTSRPLRELAQHIPLQPDRPVSPLQLDQVNRLLPGKAIDPKLWDELIAQGRDPLTYFQQTDAVIRSTHYPAAVPPLLNNFEGVSRDGVVGVTGRSVFPPDTVGDIGYDPVTGQRYYVQWVNLAYAIWNVTAAPVQVQIAAGNALWSDFGGPCQTTNDGDPIVLFDQLAGRWLLTQFSQPNWPNGPFYQCLAVSQTADPNGAYHRYAFQASVTRFNDYPHLGVWPDGYYMTANQFHLVGGTFEWAGAGAFVFERDKLLAGQAARMIYFDLLSVDANFGGMLPTDLEGITLPPIGTPNTFAEIDDNSVTGLGAVDALRLWKFHVDWQTPGNSTFGNHGQPSFVLPVAPFNWLPCVLLGTRSCIPQPPTAPAVDAVGDRLMHRLTYRSFGDHEALVMNHTVDAGSGRAGIRWYEVRDPGGNPAIYQQGTYAPNDGASRWMGSLALDHVGNLAVGYSVSSPSVYPSIRYAGRLLNDPPGDMAQGEASIITGGGSQTDPAARWGDYSSLNLDPLDDCTFWYTQEYYPTTTPVGWHTRIASFRFPNCSAGPSGVLRGAVRDAVSNNPIPNGRLLLFASSGQVIPLNAPQGLYTMTLPVATYTVTAAAYGYVPGSITGVGISESLTTTQDVRLNLSATYIISGYVADTNFPANPLFATILITGAPFDPPTNTVTTHPATGFYSVTLAADQAYTLAVSSPLHASQVSAIAALNADRTENFALSSTSMDRGGVIGWVRSLTTQQPVVSATVTITPGLETTTDHSGYFEVLNLWPGTYTITASAPLYQPLADSTVIVQASRVAFRVLDLSAPHLEYTTHSLERTLIFGTVITDETGLSVSNTGQLPLDFALTKTPAAIWLEIEPFTGTMPVTGSQNIRLSWYGNRLDQPAVYTTALHLHTNDPLASELALPVTLTLQPTVTQGVLMGMVSTTGVCDANLAPIAGAQLQVIGSGDFSRTITTNDGGHYRYWLDQTHSPYSVTLTARDHLGTTTIVSITGGMTTTQNYTLRLQQPCLSIAPTVLSATLEVGQSTTRQFTVTNSGAVPLNATIVEVFGSSIGGWDAAGYTWRRAAYDWIDATAGTPLNLPEDGAASIVLPFDFPFYGIASNQLRVSNNGAVLIDTLTGEVPFLNQPLSSAPDNIIAPFWDDLDSTVGKVYWQTIGTAPQRRVVIEWHGLPHFGYAPGVVTFELVLSENGNLAFQYQTLNFGDPAYDNGASATAGVRGVGLTQALQISHNLPSLGSQQTYCLTRPGNPPCDRIDEAWLLVAPPTITNLIGAPPTTQAITMTLTALPNLGSGVTGTLRIVTGDPFQPEAAVLVRLNVTYRCFLPVLRRN